MAQIAPGEWYYFGPHFKRVPEGWIFRSPVCWTLLGPHAHFLIDDQKKSEIEHALLERSSRGLVWIVAGLMLLPVALWVAVSISGYSWPYWLFPFVILPIYTLTLINAIFFVMLWPILADAQRTTQTISFAERYKGLVEVTSFQKLAATALLFGVMTIVAVGTGLAQSFDPLELLATMAAAAVAICAAALLIAKLRSGTRV